MAEIIKSALVPHKNDEMMSLVNRVELYPEFLKWCKKGFVDDVFDGGYVAGMLINIKGIEVEFTTRNQVITEGEYINILMTLVNGPFKKLSGQWQFKQLSSFGSKVELQLQYEVKSQILGRMFAKGFDQMAAGMVNDFVKRAGVVYAKG